MIPPITSDAVTAAEALTDHRGISMANTVHSEVASCLPLPSLPVFCGASDHNLRLFDSPLPLNRVEILSQSSKIAEMLRNTDVSYLNLRDDAKTVPYNYAEPLELHDEVLRCNPEAFECSHEVSQVPSRRRSLVVHYLKQSSLKQVFLSQVRLKKTIVQLLADSLIMFIQMTFLHCLLRNQNLRRKVAMEYLLNLTLPLFKMPASEGFVSFWRTYVGSLN